MHNSLPLLLVSLIASSSAQAAQAPPVAADEAIGIESDHLRFQITPVTGAYQIVERETGVTWASNPFAARLGEITWVADGRAATAALAQCEVRRLGVQGLDLEFRPVPDRPEMAVKVTIEILNGGKVLRVAWTPPADGTIEQIRLLDQGLWGTDQEKTSLVVPVREGLMIPSDSGLDFDHAFDTYAYEGCHLAMFGALKSGSVALATWTDPYVTAEVRSRQTLPDGIPGTQILSASLVLRRSARSFDLHFPGKGDHVTLAKAYRAVAESRGWWVPWRQKLKGQPSRAGLLGAVNYKLWSVLSRRMNEESTQEESVRVNWTFDEAAQIAEHLKRDLGLEKVLFILGGWIHRGYDNQHPDILPAAPECGGNEGLADCARRVRALGYLFCLHDNYQDMYRDAPSWDESFLMRTPDGSLARGGRWAGGRAYLTCSQKALELARRPQNLPAVRELTQADAYFIDTTYAAGLQECFAPDHPLTRADDMKWKQALSDYARGVFGIFGSECGREWALPHSDFFEGITGVSGRHFHNAELESKLGATAVPLFELVYRECIAAYGKYGYDPARAADYVLHHLALGRPLHYHNVPRHLYWKESFPAAPLGLVPGVAAFKQEGGRQFEITYRWQVERRPTNNWNVFVQFVDPQGQIRFHNDHAPVPPTSEWPTGEVRQGPFTLALPQEMSGRIEIRMGLYDPVTGRRPELRGLPSAEQGCVVAELEASEAGLEFHPAAVLPPALRADPAAFVRGDGGWTEGLHPYDRFVKNTYEILSPLYEFTAQLPMTDHAFLDVDRTVQKSVFGDGKTAVQVVVNHSTAIYRMQTPAGDEVALPPFGFWIQAPTFEAFHALSWNGLTYAAPVLFTVRSADNAPLSETRKVRVFHAFGDARLRWRGVDHRVEREAVLEAGPG